MHAFAVITSIIFTLAAVGQAEPVQVRGQCEQDIAVWYPPNPATSDYLSSLIESVTSVAGAAYSQGTAEGRCNHCSGNSALILEQLFLIIQVG